MSTGGERHEGAALLRLDRVHESQTITPQEHLALEAHAAAYAVDALEPDEALAFERHLRACAFCRAVVRDFHEAVAYLPPTLEAHDTVVEVPAGLRDRVLAAARRETAPPASEAELDAASSRLPGAPAAYGAAEPPSATDASQNAGGVVPAPQRHTVPAVAPRRVRAPWPASARALVAALLVSSLGLGAWNLMLQRQVAVERAAVAEHEAALTAAARGRLVRIVALAPVEGASTAGYVSIVLPAAGTDEPPRLLVTNLPAAPPQRSYQLWLIEGGTPRGAGTFQGASAAVEVLSVQGNSSGAQIVAITLEPRGGSPAPTTPPFLAARL